MTLLLMAAGRGSRYGKLKQFDSLGPNEEFLMEFSMYDAIESGFDHIVVITQKTNVEFLSEYLSKKLPEGVKLDVVAQEITDLPEGITFNGEREKPWGTAHAVWSARKVINNSFVVINADDYYGRSAYKKAAEFIKNNSKDYALVGYTLKDTLSEHGSVSRGVCKMDEEFNLLSVNERTKIEQLPNSVKDQDSGLEFSGDEIASMNFWVCNPSIFESFEEDFKAFLKDDTNITSGEIYLPFVIQEMLENNKIGVKVLPSGGEWFGITYASDKEKAMVKLKGMADRGDYKTPLWN
ncbi:NDP-sugar synthase [Maribacter sp. HTCC2170]|uniref:nucleotidyltransferase family protein n=1 Tax=Maribacter sp. (strain HTCC2170 / KCCM 42371) TaxID=313603 RepID=UPI0002FD0A8A|nr:sugar phosphate nucleotidyltransferase [Maribacter sp. HTCC2170]